MVAFAVEFWPRLLSQSNFGRSPVKALLPDMFILFIVEIVSNQDGYSPRSVPVFAIGFAHCALGWSKARYNMGRFSYPLL